MNTYRLKISMNYICDEYLKISRNVFMFKYYGEFSEELTDTKRNELIKVVRDFFKNYDILNIEVSKYTTYITVSEQVYFLLKIADIIPYDLM